jgi:hypothetical protein
MSDGSLLLVSVPVLSAEPSSTPLSSNPLVEPAAPPSLTAPVAAPPSESGYAVVVSKLLPHPAPVSAAQQVHNRANSSPDIFMALLLVGVA